MRYTLLDMVQDILSSMDSDEVNSIEDTSEAMQVARVIRSTYFDIVSRKHLPEHTTIFTLNASGSATYPTVMSRPTDVHSIMFVKYNKATTDDTDPQYGLVHPVTLDEFFDRMHNLDLSATEVLSFDYVIDGTEVTVLYMNDRAPSYYTYVNDSTLLFDAYDADVDSTLQASKTFCYGTKEQSFSLVDTFTPDLDEQHFALLFQESKALAFAELKQMTHQKAEASARRHMVSLQKDKAVLNDATLNYQRLPNYGRR